MTFVRIRETGERIVCAWDDCWLPGHDEIRIVVQEGRKSLIYIFCSGRHRLYYSQAHRAYGQLPAGSGRFR